MLNLSNNLDIFQRTQLNHEIFWIWASGLLNGQWWVQNKALFPLNWHCSLRWWIAGPCISITESLIRWSLSDSPRDGMLPYIESFHLQLSITSSVIDHAVHWLRWHHHFGYWPNWPLSFIIWHIITHHPTCEALSFILWSNPPYSCLECHRSEMKYYRVWSLWFPYECRAMADTQLTSKWKSTEACHASRQHDIRLPHKWRTIVKNNLKKPVAHIHKRVAQINSNPNADLITERPQHCLPSFHQHQEISHALQLQTSGMERWPCGLNDTSNPSSLQMPRVEFVSELAT